MQKKIGPFKLWQLILIVGAVVGLYAYYKYQQNNSNSPSTTAASGIDPTTGLPYSEEGAIDPTTGIPYAQEGGGGGGSLGSNASDVTGQLSTDPLQALAGSLADLQGINEELQAFGFGGIQPTTGATAQSASGGSGAAITSSNTGNGGVSSNPTIETHKGGPFYKFYVAATGHAPPAVVHTNNPLYQLWKSGAKTATTVRSGGVSNPGHTVTTHHNTKPTQKSASSSSHRAGKTGKPVASPSHQRTTSRQTANASNNAAALVSQGVAQIEPKPKKEKPKPHKRKGP